jgi:hypothetical protein
MFSGGWCSLEIDRSIAGKWRMILQRHRGRGDVRDENSEKRAGKKDEEKKGIGIVSGERCGVSRVARLAHFHLGSFGALLRTVSSVIAMLHIGTALAYTLLLPPLCASSRMYKKNKLRRLFSLIAHLENNNSL